ncbi:nucleoside/nucleotide kinase family protein [Rhodoferax sp. TS-BS-61-7]|uniref:nucleoside/nucleotide kinase family protein n=1 Tax=Rhodoferax sp. TS-BS-61-7 TaxID=2094194 RepID=UPI000CF73599|nr:nucleoside/nucleotide kinase family protein [Rhodoferax sp. TS-BS-61-7]PQA77121.1 nucleoside/nucleotide kinase family protein [Rhodoferax sp. TS-BS-61-7]
MENPNPPVLFLSPVDTQQRIAALLATGQRKLLGIVAPPGAGKSTLAQALQTQYPGQSQYLPMDGFHLAQTELERLGRAQRKGAPDTFDSAGFIALLQRIRQQTAGETVYAPDFNRALEEPIAGAIPITPGIPLVITEGNYLLLEDDGWAGARALLDEVWYLDVDPALRHSRLLARHMLFGRTREEALQWMAQTDEPNARRIEASRHRADGVVTG